MTLDQVAEQFEQVEYITGTPTTSSGTGERWYQARNNEDERWKLIYHTNGTPANRSTTTVMTPGEAKRYFDYPIPQDLAKWIEYNA